jgi:outer membrane protein TolC
VRSSWPVVACLALISAAGVAQEDPNAAQPIDLPTALRLAGAQNLDVAIARERLAEARAAHESAREQFLPWLSAGASYRRHEGRIQTVQGVIIDADKQSYNPGGTLTAQVDLGDAYFKTLAAHQLVGAAGHGLDVERRDSVLAAAQGYFDLAKAQAGVGVAREAVKISKEYEDELGQAVAIGIAFRGEELRVRVQTERERLLLRQAQEEQRVAAARLAQTLHLDPAVDLVARDADLVPLSLPGAGAELGALVSQALASRPELKESRSLVAAARETRAGAVYGPIIPTVGAQVSGGGLGGGVNGDTGHFGRSAD